MATRCAESVILDERIENPVCGTPIVQIRSIEVADAVPIREFVQSLSLETRYLRIMSPLKELSAQESRLLSQLVDTTSARGLKRIGGDVLAINEPMKVFAKAHGFALSRSHDGPTLVRVELRLDCQRA